MAVFHLVRHARKFPAVPAVGGQSQILRFGDFTLDVRKRLLLGPDSRPLPLTSRAFDTLAYLVEHPGELIDKHKLMKAVWPDTVVEENNLNQNISLVRRVLGETPGENRFVVTIPGRGFQFVHPVSRVDAEAASNGVAAPAPQAEALGSTRLDAPQTDAHPDDGAGRRQLIRAAAAIAIVLVGGYVLRDAFMPSRPKASPLDDKGQSAVTVRVPSLAVLPLINMSDDREQEYFSDGLTEELSSRLGELDGVRVVGRTSAFAFKGKNDDLRSIGRRLGVDHLVEGSVRRSGDELRITAQLVDVATGSRVWSQVYERKLDEVFAVQQDIANAVARELTARLRIGADPYLPATRNMAAYDEYLVGAKLVKSMGPAYLKGIEHLERAVAADPGFARAWGALAAAYFGAPTWGGAARKGQYRGEAAQALSRALALAPESSELILMKAELAMSTDGDWLALEQTNRQQLAKRGGDMEYWANLGLGAILLNVGRARDAVPYIRRASAAEPLLMTPSVLLLEADYQSGDWRAAEAEFERSKSLPGDRRFVDYGGVFLPALMRRDRASLQRLIATYPDPVSEAMLTDFDRPAAALAELRKRYNDPAMQASVISMLGIAHWAAFFGDPELALGALRLATEGGGVVSIIWRPLLKDVRRLPGFKQLLRDLRVVDYWRATGNWSEFCHPIGGDDFECR